MKNYLYNMIANIRNGQIVKKSFILQSKKNICESLLNVLWDEGFILGYKISENNPNVLKIFLKYKNGKPAINSLKLISKPGLRVYYSVKQLWKLNINNGTIILSTNKGVMSINECKKLNLGGEPILIVK
uniref:ribosomal protein S8 n=1 Tax=Hemiaulus sinensis TaxID=1003062 RepID=UPI0020288FB4|nr:ribosomal protein S8 [Hemiaulus sinensis]QYB23199.1 ribosomal protein S8 [Hemiaulus sinensis]